MNIIYVAAAGVHVSFEDILMSDISLTDSDWCKNSWSDIIFIKPVMDVLNLLWFILFPLIRPPTPT